jgi:hypothetical protein
VYANGQKYHQEPGSAVYAYFPPNFFRRRTDDLFGLGPDSLILTEGEFKALFAGAQRLRNRIALF